MPPGARVVERRGERVAEWTDAAGQKRRAPVTEDGSGVRIEAATFTVKFSDEHGRERKVSSRCRHATGPRA